MTPLAALAAVAAAVAAAALVLASSSTAASSTALAGSPSTVAIGYVTARSNGQNGLAWRALHPRDRATLSRPAVERCWDKDKQNAAGTEDYKFSVVTTYPDRLVLPPLGKVATTAVTIKFSYSYLGAKHSETDIVYTVKRGAQWYVVLRPATYAAYRAHRCPT